MSTLASLSVRRAGWVILLWLAVIVGLNTAVPQLEAVIARDNTAFVPEDAPSMVAFADMDERFGNGETRSIVYLVAERDGGLTGADRVHLKHLAAELAADTENVSGVTDLRARGIFPALTSEDGEAAYVQVGVPGATGAPDTARQIEAVREIARADQPDGLELLVTGPAATIHDQQVVIEHDITLITAVTVLLIAIIVFLIYRSFAITGLLLAFIGAALATGRGISALAGHEGWFHVSTFTASFVTAVVLGAATDYAIFLLSRFHELRRDGVDPVTAVALATAKVASVIVGSALTVVLATAAMALAQVGLFNTTGPAIALSVAMTLLLCLTLLPALMRFVAPRGWIDPHPSRGANRWAGIAAYVVANPGRVLAAGLAPLLLLAALYPAMALSFDERGVQPDDTESNRGYAMLDDHYPPNEVIADFVLITSDHDLRNPKDLAAIEQAARNVARVPGVASVMTVTRPLGEPLTQATLGYQVGVAGDRLGKATGKLGSGVKNAEKLHSGASELATGATRLASGADRAATGAGQLLSGAEKLADGVARLATGATTARSGSTELRAGADQLADGLEAGISQVQLAVDGLALAHQALKKSLTCGLDPYCRGARDGIQQIYVGERDELLPGLREAAKAARAIANGTIDLEAGLTRIETGLATASSGATQLEAGQRTLATKLGTLAGGAEQVADGTAQVEGGTAEIASRVGELATGLERASTYLTTTGKAGQDPAVSGFYLPQSALDDPRFALAKGLYVSADGHAVRMIVKSETDAYGLETIHRSDDLAEGAERGLADTRLAGSTVQVTGMPTVSSDIEKLSAADFRLVAGVALLVVLLILLVLLRSIVAALFLLATVVLSYAAAMGLAVLTWQVLLDIPIEWTVPVIVFVLLVAVGADYNMLLIKRIRDEAPDGSPAGIARALTVTGSVITAAGLIFAASMFALMAGNVITLMQIGFTIGMGLLLDTFVVRTFVVPAFAALVGPRLWWPSAAKAPAP